MPSSKFKGVVCTREFKKFLDHLPETHPRKTELLLVMKFLQENYWQGNKVPHELWPRLYKNKYKINNLWRLALRSGWRMLYTMFDEKDGFAICIIEALSHRDYEKRFGY